MTAVDVTVRGRVQGVSFRYYAQREACRLDVHGWVRNEPDGTVACHFEGDAAAVDAMVDWCRRGPVGARVTNVAVREGADTGASHFDVRY